MAIDRKTIVDRIMDGLALPANQFIPAGMFGAIDQAPALEYNPKKAKQLLAEAGYPDGFELTLSATNDRYINDAQVTQAVAQYLSRIGIKTQVDRSEEHTSELQSLMRISYAVFCLKKKTTKKRINKLTNT